MRKRESKRKRETIRNLKRERTRGKLKEREWDPNTQTWARAHKRTRTHHTHHTYHNQHTHTCTHKQIHMHIHIHTHIHTHTHHTRTHTHTHTQTRTHIHTHTHIHTQAHTHEHTHDVRILTPIFGICIVCVCLSVQPFQKKLVCVCCLCSEAVTIGFPV